MSNDRPTIDQIVLRKANTHNKGLWQAEEYGVRREFLSSKSQEAWDFIERYQSENEGQRPGDSLLVHRMRWPEVPLDELGAEITLRHACNMIISRHIENKIRSGIIELEQELTHQGVEPAFNARQQIIQLADQLREVDTSKRTAVDIHGLFPQVAANYQRYKAGDIGIDTPWPTITKHIKGYQPGHVVYFVARPQTGKTWILLKNCLHLHDNGYKILLISPELKKVEAAERLACMRFGLSYDQFTEGKLSTPQEQKLEHNVKQVMDHKGFLILDDEMKIDTMTVETAIETHDPDVVAVDSMYKYGDGYNTQERIRNAAQWLAETARRGRERLMIATSQMNRDAVNKETTILENIYGSDAIAQDAHVVYGMYRDEGMEELNAIGFKQLKIRRGKYHPPFVASMDMDTMDFDEVDESFYEREEDMAVGPSQSSISKQADLY